MAILRVAVQAWLDWRQPSGARTRLRGLLTAWADLPESREVEVHLLGSEDPDPVLAPSRTVLGVVRIRTRDGDPQVVPGIEYVGRRV